MKYYTEFNLPPVVPSESGKPTQTHYRLDPIKGEVIADGEDEFQALINAAKDSCDIHKIVARFNQTNDETLLQIRSTVQGFDFTNFPESALAANMKLRELRDDFESSPDLIAKFGTFKNFTENALNPDFYSQPQKPAKPAKEGDDQ